MYLVDFLKKLTRKSNIFILIYLVLNVLVIGYVIQLLFGETTMPYWIAFLVGLVIYGISLVIALSPVGEWILRFQTGCRKINRIEQINFIEPLFRDVYGRARQLDPSIPEDVQLFVNDDENANAFATGRKTICVTEGLLHLPEDQIKAALGHEFGHLAHKDTDLILLITVGNFIVTTIVTIFRVIIWIVEIICSFFSDGWVGTLGSFLTLIFVDGAMWAWTKIGTIMVMQSSRSNEYEADEFSFNLGYGESLCALIDSFEHSGAKGLFATLESSHPDKDERIAKLQVLGSNYRSSYKFGTSNTEIMGGTLVENTITCSFCGAKISMDSKFCSVCGNAVKQENNFSKVICQNCGAEAEDEDAVYCIICGTKLRK